MLYIYPFLVLGFPFVVWPREVHALAFLPAGFHHCIYSGPICLGGQGTGVLCSKFSLGLNWSLHLCKHRLYMSYLPCWSWGSGLCMYSWIFLWERCWGLFLFVLFFSQLCWISFNVLRPQVTVFFTAFSRQCKDCYLNGDRETLLCKFPYKLLLLSTNTRIAPQSSVSTQWFAEKKSTKGMTLSLIFPF